MDKTWKWEPTADEVADIEEAIQQCVAEMERATEQMTRDQGDIEKLKAETRAILAALRVA